MKVIRHQTVMIQSQAEAFPVARQQAKKMAAIVVIAKDPLPVVAAVHDVVTRFLRPLLLHGVRGIGKPLWAIRSRLSKSSGKVST